jgi:hypothetical protein
LFLLLNILFYYYYLKWEGCCHRIILVADLLLSVGLLLCNYESHVTYSESHVIYSESHVKYSESHVTVGHHMGLVLI